MNNIFYKLTLNVTRKVVGIALLLSVFLSQANAIELIGGLGGSSGFGTVAMSRNDDGTSRVISLDSSFPSGINFFGTTYNSLYINNNGNITFKAPVLRFTPTPFPISASPMIAAYWGDVDTRGSVPASEPPGSNNVYYSFALPGKLVVTWFNVGYYVFAVNKLNSFQIIVTDRSDTGVGNADVEFRYNRLEWTTGSASGGSNGLGGTPAQIGFDAGDLKNFFSHPDSRTAKILDAINTTNVGIPGVWRFELRAGTVIEPPKNMLKDVVAKIYLPASGVSVDPASYKKAPDSNTIIGEERVLEWRYATLLASQIEDLSFDLTLHSPLGGEQRKVIYKATLDYIDVNNKPVHAELDEQVVTVEASQYSGTIATDQTSYQANSDVQLTSLIRNKGQFAANATATITILAPDNNAVARLAPMEINNLSVDSTKTFAHSWNTLRSYIGQYTAVLEVTDSITGNKSLAQTVFNIVDSNGSDVGVGLVSGVDKQVYRVNDTVLLESFINNKALNATRSGLSLIAKVLSPSGTVVYEHSVNLPELTPESYTENKQSISLDNAEAGEYTVTVSLYSAQGDLLVTDLLVLQVEREFTDLIKGEVNIASVNLDIGQPQTCEFIVKNIGESSYDGLAVVKSLVEFESQSVIHSQQETVSLLAASSLSDEDNFSTNHLAPGAYACVLEAIVHGQNIVLAVSQFTLVESPIKVTGDIGLGEKARLLVLVDVPPAGAYGEILYLKSLLNNAGWHYTMVDSAKDFDRELLTGSYGAYALLSERITLTPKTRELLMIEVALGDGLLVSNGHDRRHQSLEDALGIRLHSKQTQIAGIEAQQSPVGEAWSHTFNTTFKSMTFDLVGATTFGNFVLANPQNTAAEKPLGMASDFNVFVLDNYTSLSSTVEGRIAVGGNLNLNNFSVGDKLNPAKRGDVVVVGGDVTFPSGRIYNGNLRAGGSVAGVGSAVRNGMAKGAVIAGNSYLPVEFGNESAYMQDLSTNLAALPATGTVTLQWGGYELKGDCTSKLQVFNVNAAELATVHTYAVSCIPSGATVIFNILGEAATIQNMGMQSLTAIRDKVLFNFPQAKTVKLTSVAIEGSILAPYAEFVQPAGRVEGQVIAKSWLSTTSGYMSIHNRVFSGDVSAAWASTANNALSYFQYQQGKTLFAGFDVADHAYTLSKSLTANQQNHFANLLLNGLLNINPDETLTRAGKVVPVVITMANTGTKPAVGQASLSLSENLSIKVADGFTQIPNTFTWDLGFSLAPEVQQQKTIYIQLPNTTGASERIDLLLQTGIAPDVVTQAEKTLDIPIR